MAAYIVTTLEDENDSVTNPGSPGGTGLSLREAIVLANNNAGPDSITFASGLASGTISLNSTLSVVGETTIDGNIDGDSAPDITLDAHNDFRILAANAALTVDGVAFKNGDTQYLGYGGAILSSASLLTISNCSFDNNVAIDGGAIWAENLDVSSSSFTGNSVSYHGGAIFTQNSLSVSNSTFANNMAGQWGGAIKSSGYDPTNISNSTFFENNGLKGSAIYSEYTLNIFDSTLVGNISRNATLSVIRSYYDTTTLSNSIVFGNTGTLYSGISLQYAGQNITSDGSTTFVNGVASTIPLSLADLFVTSGGAAVLADNGGPVKTIALNPDAANPALDAGGLSTDARGVDALDIPNLGSAAGDLGAYEYATRVISVDADSADGIYWLGQTITITVTFDNLVQVIGAPTLLLETGTTDREATFVGVGGSNANVLTFTYIVQAGDTAADLDFASTAALLLNGGTINGQLSDAAVPTLPTTGSTLSLAGQANIKVRGVEPPAAPVLASPLVDQPATEDTAFSFVIPTGTFTDVNGDTLSYTATLANDSALPSWLGFNASTHTFSGTPLNADVGIVTVKVTASDGSSSVSDEFVLTVANTNDAPTAVTLSSNAIAENAPAGTVIGDLSAVDPDAGDTATFSLLSSAGSRFALVGNQLVVAEGAVLDFEGKKSYSVTVRATDAAGETVDQQLTINLTDIDDTVIGTKGNNVLKGGAGDELLDGRAGNDRLAGGDGADTFVFGKGYGRDTITDFDPREGDIIDLSGAVGIKNFRDLIRSHIEDTGKDLVISADDGSILVLKGVNADDLGRDSFVF